MANFQPNPVKLFIEDIFCAKRSEAVWYNYELFNITFKKIKIHGVITSIQKHDKDSIHFELSDATGSVDVIYDLNKRDNQVNENTRNEIIQEHGHAIFGSQHSETMEFMKKVIFSKPSFTVGSHASVVGYISKNTELNTRFVCAFDVKPTCILRDLAWMQDVLILYEKYYSKNSNKHVDVL